MKPYLPMALFVCLLLSSCNNNQAEKEAAAKQAILDYQKREQEINTLKASVDKLAAFVESNKNTAADYDGKIASARDEVASASEFKLFRSHSQREADIENANRNLSKLIQDAEDFKKTYAEAQDKLQQLQTQLASMKQNLKASLPQ